jgi:adenylate kinase
VTQAELLTKFAKFDMVVNINLREDVLVQKIVNRRVCVGCGNNYNLADIKVLSVRSFFVVLFC